MTDATGNRVREASGLLSEQVAALDPQGLDISPYYRAYLQRIKDHRDYYFSIYEQHLLLALSHMDNQPGELAFLDYGAGCGMLSLLARKCGFRQVICSDIYNLSVRDAQVIAKYLGLEADVYITGDMSDITAAGLRADVVAGMDVVEHIYDLEQFFREAARLNAGNLVLCLGTGSNPYNPVKRKELQAVQNRLEYEGSGGTLKERDSKEAYCDIRKRLILETKPDLSSFELEAWGERTRGMAEKDILACLAGRPVSTYMPRLRSNTSDPLTGNWAERLLYEDEYTRLCQAGGFSLQWVNGYYDHFSGNALKKFLASSLNFLIRLGGKPARRLSPYTYLVFLKRN